MRYRRSKDIAWRTIGGQAFIVTTRTSTLHELNETGTAIWNYLDRPRTIADIAGHLAAEFEVTPPDAQRDTVAYLSQLEKAGLVEHAN